MDTQKCKALLKVAEHGSFSKAAKDLGYTQSALSQMISSMESELGFKLIERLRSGSRLTIEGTELISYIETFLNSERALLEKAAEISGLETGVIRIGTIASISAHWLPALIREFEAAYPGVTFVIHQGDYNLIPEWIRTGLVDFGFANPSGVSGLESCMLKTGKMSAVLPKDHSLAKKKKVPLKELSKEPYILMEEGGYYEPLEAFSKCGCTPNIKYTIHDDYSIMAMIDQSLGVSILADLIMQRCPYDLVSVPTTPSITRNIALVYRDESRLPIAAKRFMELVKQRVADLP